MRRARRSLSTVVLTALVATLGVLAAPVATASPATAAPQVDGSTDAYLVKESVFDEFHPEVGYRTVETYSSYQGLIPRQEYLVRIEALSDGYSDAATATADSEGGISENDRFEYDGADHAHWHEGETVEFSLIDPVTSDVLSTSDVQLVAKNSGLPPFQQVFLDQTDVVPGRTVQVTGTGFSGGRITGAVTPKGIPGGTYESGILGGIRGSFTVPVGTRPGTYFLQLTDHGPDGTGYGFQFSVLPDPAPGTFRAVTPARVLDTRSGNGAARGQVKAGAVVNLQVTGPGGVPAKGVGAVALEVTVASSTSGGYLTAYPGGTARPTASNLNYPGGAPIANLVTVPLGAGGQVALFNGGGAPVDLVADVAGYFVGGTPTVAGAFAALTPTRVLDTRTGTGAPRATVAAGGTLVTPILGRGGVPNVSVAAVVLDLTATNATAGGYLTVFADDGSPRPAVSNLNYAGGKSIANLVTVPLGNEADLTIYNGGSRPVDVLADVAGYYLPGSAVAPGAFVPVAPSRVLDTRTGNGASGRVAATTALGLQVAGRGGVPASGAGAAVLNLAAVAPTASGYVTAYPNTVSHRPTVSSLNFATGQTIAGAAIVPLGTDGEVGLFNGSATPLDLLADVAGYYLS